MVRLRGVHPPSVHAKLEDAVVQVFPIDVARLGRISIIHPHARRIFGIGRPGFGACRRPRLEVVEQPLGSQFAVGLRGRSEGRPDGDGHVRVHPMHVVEHLLWIRELRIGEVHRVPQVIVPPILPILDDAVEGHTQLTVLAHHADHFGLALVAFLALPITIRPQGEHGHLARQVAHLRHHAVGIPAVHHVIVHAVAHVRTEGSTVRVIHEKRRGIVVPIQAVAFRGLEERTHVFRVALNHVLPHAALRHLPVLQLAETVNGFVLLQLERLVNRERRCAGIVERGEHLLRLLLAQQLVAAHSERNHARRGIQRHVQRLAVEHDVAVFR